MDPYLQRLWRHRGTTLPTPRRGPRQQLDLDQILEAGIALADASGLQAVSTRAVAARFGKTAMALYPYVGTKDNLLALMQDHASALPTWESPRTGLADSLRAWATALFELYLAHPWLTERLWSQASQGPNEQDWLERLLGILAEVPAGARAPAVTMLYATVRATAQTAAAYRRMGPSEMATWLERATAVPDFAARYPLSTSLEPVAPRWQDSPRASLVAAVDLLAAGLATVSPSAGTATVRSSARTATPRSSARNETPPPSSAGTATPRSSAGTATPRSSAGAETSPPDNES